MVMPAVKAQILNDLSQLSPPEQRMAAELVRALVTPLPKGASVEDLLQVTGTLGDEAAHQMMEAIEEGCERVDLHEW